jgi:hypothetical protein
MNRAVAGKYRALSVKKNSIPAMRLKRFFNAVAFRL